MDFAQLRSLLAPHILGLKDAVTHQGLPALCAEMGLPTPTSDGSKRDRMASSLEALTDEDLPRVAGRFLEIQKPSAILRNAIQELIWANSRAPEVPKKFRREVSRVLNIEDLYIDCRRFDELLNKLWILDDDPMEEFFGLAANSLRASLDRHVYRNPGDWSVEVLFDRLGVFEASDRRFAYFIEGLASSEVRPDEASQRAFVRVINDSLAPCGAELRETGTDGGYPVFALLSNRIGNVRPKNLIFASSVKPDIRFRDALNNDIEIVGNADKVLVYDRPISNEGLRWRDLQLWWSETNGISNIEEAKKTLYRRLRSCLPQDSPPQRTLFEAFHESFGAAVPDLPALVPEVWLHWDPKSARQRGPDALLRFRMDFLMLLPNGIRIVIEVDGKHHYSHEDGRADPGRYGSMMSADRDLRLAGYEIFRFGGAELCEVNAQEEVKKFFKSLFDYYHVPVPAGCL
jgi:very-short-patch-repair endonuclease